MGCEFSGSTEGGLAYRLKFTPGECRLVEYSGSNLIRFAVEYPGMEVADFSGEVKKSLVFFYLEYVSQSKFDENRVLEGKVPSSVVDGVESYDVGGFVERKFKGGDGVFVYVSSEINTFRASRLYRPGLWVSYQYSKLNDDVRKMDDFALKVLGKAIVE